MAFQLKGHISSPCAPSRSEMRQLGSSSPPVVCRHSCVAAFKFHAAARAISYECRIRRGEGKMGQVFRLEALSLSLPPCPHYYGHRRDIYGREGSLNPRRGFLKGTCKYDVEKVDLATDFVQICWDSENDGRRTE